MRLQFKDKLMISGIQKGTKLHFTIVLLNTNGTVAVGILDAITTGMVGYCCEILAKGTHV